MTEPCKHCGKLHSVRCPDVKAIEYHPDGSIKRVEYVTPADLQPMIGGFRINPPYSALTGAPPYPPTVWYGEARPT